jgi:hypothetical protein
VARVEQVAYFLHHGARVPASPFAILSGDDGLESAQGTGNAGRIVATRKLSRKDFFSTRLGVATCGKSKREESP